MLRLLADENFNNNLLRALFQQVPDLDVVRVQDSEVGEAKDPAVLAWAAQEGRVLLTHDVKTIPRYVYERVYAGLPMPGVIEVNPKAETTRIIEDLLLIVQVYSAEEMVYRILYVPLK